ncbi:MAG: HPr kinase/phosphatase C-terminal domain-containing protein [Candidatus Andeanibacterium colombiense]|uniref:HPr kinase/phosphatase C-terminal domain-containing protein n=1 Tax=Candidatus Andeanibacterium colombiense TaxID=3121345 RepID=A0AAJ6BPY0_9SPHN|nr:MAG: HPr kinase/phosphatase C-terminal domain-containing protein [Sphingomonadaceae bacterium]
MSNASCVAVPGASGTLRGVLIEGLPGSGKSSLVLALIDRGAVLVGDDGVTLVRRGERLWAAPPPNTAGRLEIRNVGLIELPAAEAPVSLVLRLEEGAPRFIDKADETDLEGLPLPLVRLWPGSPMLALRAEWALKLYGVA